MLNNVTQMNYNTTDGTFWHDSMKIRYLHIMSFMKRAQAACTYMTDSSKWVGGFTPNNRSLVEIPTVTNCTNTTDPTCC